MRDKFTQANILKFAAMAIAAPRYMGAFAVAIGINAVQDYSWLAAVEVLSGAAMALLEGFAVAFVLSKWRLLKPGSASWWVLLAFASLLALTLPLVATPYLLTEQDGSSVASLFAGYRLLQVCWSILVAGVPVLVIMAVGFADVDEFEREAKHAVSRAKVKQARQQAESKVKQSRFACERCGERFGSQQALNGHKAHCKGIAKSEPGKPASEPSQASTNGKMSEAELAK